MKEKTYGDIAKTVLRLSIAGETQAIKNFMAEYIAEIHAEGKSIEEATEIAFSNVRYLAGYYDEHNAKLIKKHFTLDVFA